MTEWRRDPIDRSWRYAYGIGVVRGPGYRPGGWWFLPEDAPDTEQHDVGPFKTQREAIAYAERRTP